MKTTALVVLLFASALAAGTAAGRVSNPSRAILYDLE
jgi:hypothetical protein